MPKLKKVTWTFFVATSMELAFLQPYIKLIPGERANLFSGLLCFLPYLWIIFWNVKVRCATNPLNFYISCLVTFSHSQWYLKFNSRQLYYSWFYPLGLWIGGTYWYAKILLKTPSDLKYFQQLSMLLLFGVLLLSSIGYLVYDKTNFFGHPHSLAGIILLFSFAPLSIIIDGTRPKVIWGILLL